MSEISVLSNQYDKLVTTSDQINDSVITLKKKSILEDTNYKQAYPNLNVSHDEVRTAQSRIIPFLKNVQRIIRGEPQEPEYIPSIILEDYKQRLFNSHFIEGDLNDVIDKIDGDGKIDEDSIGVLDEILSILDTERSTLFRKLRTARG